MEGRDIFSPVFFFKLYHNSDITVVSAFFLDEVFRFADFLHFPGILWYNFYYTMFI